MTSPEKPVPRHKKESFFDLRQAFDSFMGERPIKGLLQSMDELFTFQFADRHHFPVDVREEENHFLVSAKLPGIPRQQIHIEAIRQSLMITVTHKEETEMRSAGSRSYYRGQSLNTSSRTISFAKPIDEKNISASHKDGLLIVTVPKIRGKRITISE
ncbi:Hsp20/alpha crystallin family protein [Peribacillus kribbensis]|uniref:Hsp20/alpha crystallin family protein n=1 Tax=Peribacillus kribbensis TaxID=356658 RepID=UPI0003FD893A|nr:Hsp20/alpha crystallin family protein [Peribacillus kribbensis]